MKITFLSDYGNFDDFEEYILMVGNGLDKEKHQHKLINITNLNINQCIGCFSCWLKTPGKCIYNDDMENILETIVKTDVLIFSSCICICQSKSVPRFRLKSVPLHFFNIFSVSLIL